MKLRLKRLRRNLFKFYGSCAGGGGGGGGGSSVISDNKECCVTIIKEIEWEVRPGGMIIQKRDDMEDQKTEKEGSILVRVVTNGSQCCDISIQATSTFGELKMMLSKMTGLEPQEQRVLFKGKEREDTEHLHMVGVTDQDRLVMLEDPAIKESKVHGSYHYKL